MRAVLRLLHQATAAWRRARDRSEPKSEPANAPCHRRAGECRCRSTDPQFLPHIEQQRREQQKRDLMRGKPQTIINAVRRGDPQVLGWLNQRRVASRQNTHRIDT